MGVDWRTIGWGEYSFLLAAWNAAHDADKPKAGDGDQDRLRRFMSAHSLH